MDNQQGEPRGELSIRTLAMPADANPSGDIFGGWVLSQMDIGGGIAAGQHGFGPGQALGRWRHGWMSQVSHGTWVKGATIGRFASVMTWIGSTTSPSFWRRVGGTNARFTPTY